MKKAGKWSHFADMGVGWQAHEEGSVDSRGCGPAGIGSPGSYCEQFPSSSLTSIYDIHGGTAHLKKV